MTPLRQLSVCADDYGLGAAVDRGILALAAQGRITALSCLVTPPRWDAAGAALQDCPVATGLHFNLTEGRPLSPSLRLRWPRFPGLGALMAQAFLGRLPAELPDEFQAQLQRFVAVTGRAPDFIDGHQHVHALPGVRPIVLAAAQGLGLPLRSTGRVAGPGFAFKRRVIEACGGRALGAEMQAERLPAVSALVGVYDFDPHADYRALMRGWLGTVPDGALLFCHPALGQPDVGDAIAAARANEMAYLASEAFSVDLAEFGVRLA
ncbi:ChbG/HpnK family deacetylase [Roseateles sp.]|uniref:ChbG/HpnK family deacetylase n=1 Tax=Roseateles sp. TaxID=1971397 RepID=UPI0025E1A80F|nr:ChbG/HpnK family deacetylase [Roseateles sp.]MBV8037096.1 ChbG/HpnK family deacetylase [Roseateles sp.]